MNLKFLVALVGTALVVGVGAFFLGRAAAPGHIVAVAAPLPTMGSKAPSPAQAGDPTGVGSQPPQAPASEPALAEGRNDPGIATFEYDQALADVQTLEELLTLAPETPEKYAKIQSLKQALLTKAQRNSQTLQGLIAAFRDNPASLPGEHLKSILAEIPDPEVEALALELSAAGDSARQLAGLDLLGQLNIPSEAGFKRTAEIIALGSGEPEVLMSAIQAMPHIALPESELNEVLRNLSSLAESNPSEGVRSASLFSLGKWAKAADDLTPVIAALDPQRPADDRISAAMALKASPLVDDHLREVLVGLMDDQGELWEIRRMAAESLQRFKLDADDFAAYQQFLRQQGDIATGAQAQ